MSTDTPGIEACFVRPGRAALAWAGEVVASLKASDPLRPVTVVVPNFYAGRSLRWELARHGGYVNVHAVRLTELASRLAGAANQPVQPLTPVLEESAVRRAVDEVGAVLAAGGHHRSLHQALLQLFRELRRRELDAAAVEQLAPSDVVRAALQVYRRFRELTRDYDDPNSARDRATRRLQEATAPLPALAEIGAVVLFLPTRLDPVDARLLGALARWVPVKAALAYVDDPSGLGNELSREAERLLGVTAEVLDAPADHLSHTPVERIVRTPDAPEEVREVLRSIAADLERGVPLHRTAILYRQTDEYAALLREALDAAGLPWSALEGRSLAESRPGRALLALLGLPDQQFSRGAVMAWVDEVGAPAGLPGTAWDRISRAANVSRGADQWRTRLGVHALQLEEDAERSNRDGYEARARANGTQARQARAMAAMVEELESALRPPPEGARWSDFVGWADGLRQRYADSKSWPESEQLFADDVAKTLASLAQADQIETDGGARLSLFRATLQAALEARARPVGRLGEGILVGPVQSVTGLAFDSVYLLGMVEGAFPPGPPADPFFPGGTADPLGSREDRRRRERLTFLTAVAAADGGRLTLSAPDAAGGRAAFPSPWLLERASALHGAPLYTSSFRALGSREDEPWLRVVHSPRHGVDTTPALADLEDRRLAEASRWQQTGRWLSHHPLGRRLDLPVGPGLALQWARRSKDFTAFDGNLDELRGAGGLTRLLDSTTVTSASAVETWATCPFRYFLGYVLRVERTTRPEESWTIDALERGSLVHDILDRFFHRLQEQERPGPDERYGAADYALMEEIAAERFEDSERRGVTGHGLVWENTRAAIRADLRAFLAEDEQWRRASRLRPAHFEQAFGTSAPGAWPPVAIPVASGELRFRGYIDRVDVDEAGRRAHVFDYKTGGASSYRGIEEDPVLAGRHVQLALYARAVRDRYGEDMEVGADFWLVTSKGEFRRVGAAADRDQVEGRMRDVLEVVGSGIKQGVFPQVPGDEDRESFRNCTYCDFDRVCPAARDDAYKRKGETELYQLHGSLTLPKAKP